MWEDLTPIVKTTPRATASISILKSGVAKVKVGFSEMLHRDFGEFDTCKIQAGTGENLGMIRLTQFAKLNKRAKTKAEKEEEANETKGLFIARHMAKGGAACDIPMPAGLPRIDTESYPCEVIRQAGNSAKVGSGGYELILKLPLDQWKEEQQRQTRGPARDLDITRRPSAPAPQAPPPPPRQSVDELALKVDEEPPRFEGSRFKFDACKYLALKGEKVTRNENGTYIMHGRTIPKQDVLAKINEYRKKGSFPLWSISQIE